MAGNGPTMWRSSPRRSRHWSWGRPEHRHLRRRVLVPRQRLVPRPLQRISPRGFGLPAPGRSRRRPEVLSPAQSYRSLARVSNRHRAFPARAPRWGRHPFLDPVPSRRRHPFLVLGTRHRRPFPGRAPSLRRLEVLSRKGRGSGCRDPCPCPRRLGPDRSYPRRAPGPAPSRPSRSCRTRFGKRLCRIWARARQARVRRPSYRSCRHRRRVQPCRA